MSPYRCDCCTGLVRLVCGVCGGEKARVRCLCRCSHEWALRGALGPAGESAAAGPIPSAPESRRPMGGRPGRAVTDGAAVTAGNLHAADCPTQTPDGPSAAMAGGPHLSFVGVWAGRAFAALAAHCGAVAATVPKVEPRFVRVGRGEGGGGTVSRGAHHEAAAADPVSPAGSAAPGAM